MERRVCEVACLLVVAFLMTTTAGAAGIGAVGHHGE
jgi:hypothetical protein